MMFGTIRWSRVGSGYSLKSMALNRPTNDKNARSFYFGPKRALGHHLKCVGPRAAA